MKYAVIIKGTMYVPGDERSRTNPGHSYPGGYEDTTEFMKFGSEDEMRSWLKTSTYKNFTLIQYEELEVITSFETRITKEV